MRQNDFSIRIWAIIIGVRKCGTRALLAFCGLHPNIVHAGKYMFFFIASQSLERRSYQFIITSLRNYNRKCCNFFLWGSRYRTIVLLEILIFDMFKILVYLIQWRSKPRFDKLVVKSTMLQHLQFIPIWPIFPIFDCAAQFVQTEHDLLHNIFQHESHPHHSFSRQRIQNWKKHALYRNSSPML